MTNKNHFDVIIIGGSYAGLAAAMALGRALKKVLVVDDGKPCNRQTPHSHNFLTNDGKAPAEIAALANQQVSRYDSVSFLSGRAITAEKTEAGFKVLLAGREIFTAKKLVFATGIKDLLAPISGLAECWGISVIHCPYCHGYEVRNEKTGILGNGDTAFDFTKLISNWAKDLTVFTNGTATFNSDQIEKLLEHRIEVIDRQIEKLEQSDGHLRHIIFKDGTSAAIKALYAPAPFEQHCKIPESLGCEMTEEGYIKIDSSLETTIKGVFAIGDNASKMRTVANAIAMGTSAGMMISKKMIMEAF
ncbi:MAG: NAD(P)/FAD-dependent oxidoreductase [Chitinophagaceae bacterium]|nr:NAD(P)/FAD-dependent oxidoreductase [Chitinophagaceae bacterium]MBL0202078.1 NAD(P)/FAD-dependent oxidoreductase [Chitinophagaceae bacterium]